MKSSIKLLFICLSSHVIIFGACTGQRTNENEETLTVDVSRQYPAKKMILQDIAEVEYIPLETSDDMLWQGGVSTFTGQYILNHQLRNGDILFFDRKGKGIKKLNRQGGSGEEHSPFSNFLFDEENGELYLNDRNKKKIFVYDLDGGFKRILEYTPDKRYADLRNFDAGRLIAYNDQWEEDIINSYLIISKSTGEIEQEFSVPQTGRKIIPRETVQDGQNVMVYSLMPYPLTVAYPDFLLADLSNDTIFRMNRSLELKPIAIQQPSRPTMAPERLLFWSLESENYIFFEILEKKFNITPLNIKIESWELVYDKKEGKFYTQDIQNGDFTSERKVTVSPQHTCFSATNRNIYLELLNAADLIEAYENNQLKGRLKEIAQGLDEEDNPVLMVVRFK